MLDRLARSKGYHVKAVGAGRKDYLRAYLEDVSSGLVSKKA
jgi:hypothetical protein